MTKLRDRVKPAGGTLPCGCSHRHRCDQHLSLMSRAERAAWFRANPADFYQWPTDPKWGTR